MSARRRRGDLGQGPVYLASAIRVSWSRASRPGAGEEPGDVYEAERLGATSLSRARSSGAGCAL